MPLPTFEIDDPSALDACCYQLVQPSTSNFVVTFNANTASCIPNFDKDTIASLLQDTAGRPPGSTRWINIWATDDQKEILDVVAKHFDVSPRNRVLLQPVKTKRNPPPKKDENSGGVAARQFTSHRAGDVEKGVSVDTSEVSRRKAAESEQPFATLVDELWHFYTVGDGPRYLHIGYNALFTGTDVYDSLRYRPTSSRPFECRIWTSLLLCDENTVISIYEDPVDNGQPSYQKTVKTVRRNVLNVFRHLSHGRPTDGQSDLLSVINLRPASSRNQTTNTDDPSLLCFYLLDDWMATYTLVTRRANRYRETLEYLRKQMFQAADLELINTLHQTGQQLTTLKRVYQTYGRIITHLLERHRSDTDRRSSLFPTPGRPGRTASSTSPFPSPSSLDAMVSEPDPSTSSVRLAESALTRFERLRDRIELLALTEVQECLEEKDSLVVMNFNLITFRESQAIEKLAKITILLAKGTLMFLPLGLVTAFFSMTFDTIKEDYSLTTFWVSFVVVGAISLISITLLGSMYRVPKIMGAVKGAVGRRLGGRREAMGRMTGGEK